MAYKQNNPLSRKSNSTPLRHNVRNSAGDSWRHVHQQNGFIKTLTGKLIKGSSDFGQRANRAVKDRETNSKRLSAERGGGRATEKNYAMDYANQIANMYNRGELVGGQFIADDFDKRKAKTSIKKGKFKIDPRFKAIGESRDYNVQYADQVEGFDKDAGYQTAETQYTPDQIYDMMVQGGGMVSIVDGKIVAGNPNESKYQVSDADWDYADERISKNRGVYGDRNIQVNKFEEGYVPEGYMDERSKTKVDPNRTYTVKELLELRKQKRNSAINRVTDDSPLNTGHETDERSTEARQGFIYTPGEEVVTTRTEEVYGPDGVTVIGTNTIKDTTITNTGTRNTPGTTKVITDEPNETPPNWDDCYKNGIFQTGAIVGEGVNAIKCELKPDPGPNPEGEPIIEKTQPVTEQHIYDDVNTETVFTPIEVEEPVVVRDRFSRSSGSLKGKGLEFTLPQLESMSFSQLKAAKSKCGRCKSAGLINVLLGRRSG